ncbi:MAG: hypothetical protein QOG57_4089, partial [Pseudonocardiales bacterium]|nr:hypothetical protein [Pseudonocardiales bacterium]
QDRRSRPLADHRNPKQCPWPALRRRLQPVSPVATGQAQLDRPRREQGRRQLVTVESASIPSTRATPASGGFRSSQRRDDLTRSTTATVWPQGSVRGVCRGRSPASRSWPRPAATRHSRRGDVRDLARRHPGSFLLGAVASGVLAGRLTRSLTSSESSSLPRPSRPTDPPPPQNPVSGETAAATAPATVGDYVEELERQQGTPLTGPYSPSPTPRRR